MVAIKFDKKGLLKAAKLKKKPDKSNCTFRLDIELMKAFKGQCEKEGVTPTSIIEEFLKEFIKQ